MVPEPGEFVGPYEILGQLGTGGMGIVFRAWDERLHREVALKLLHNQYDTPNLRERFLIEARAASGLNHPNICTIFDLGEQDGEPYLVMELMTGQTLKEKLARGALSTEEIVRTSIEVADALAWAHSKGVVHRDIKPANIFLLHRPGGSTQAKVLDFGLAKVTATSRSGRASRALELTSAGTTVGTLAYMSPEQARGEAIDPRSDLFSLGIIMYEMCTRRVPFQGTTSALVFAALLSQDPESIRTWNDAIPRDLERVVYRLLAKSRGERFQSAHELHQALHRLTLKDDGDWLRKLPRPSVPLVMSADPVARAQRGLKSDRGELPVADESSVQELSAMAEDDSEAEHHMLRPRRLPRRESGPRESAFGSAGEAVPAVRDPTRFDNVTRVRVAPEGRATQVQAGALQAGTAPQESRSKAPMAHATVTVKSRGEQAVAGMTAVSEEKPTAAIRAVGSALGVLPEAAEDHVPVPAEIAPRAGMNPDPEERSDDRSSFAEPSGRRTRWLAGGAAALVLLSAFLAYRILHGGLTQVVLHPGDAVLLTPFENKTGEPDLDRAIAQGLEIELGENSSLHFDGLTAYRAGMRQVVRETRGTERAVRGQAIAQRIGARAYLYGEIHRAGPGYALSLTVVEAASNDRMAVLSTTSPNRDSLAEAITQLSVGLRKRLGEGAGVDTRHLTPLASQGTANMAALQSYADAGVAAEEGRRLEALRGYQRAVALAPGFALAEVRLAWLLEREGAEVEAAEAAQSAQQYSRRSGDRVGAMAQYTRQALADHDLAAATLTARAMTVARPDDVESLMALARVMRLGNHMTEALLSAEQAATRGPFHAAAYDEQARALVSLDRVGDAAKLSVEAASKGVDCDCAGVAVRYLSGTAEGTSAGGEAAADPLQVQQRALAFDNAGRLAEGLRAWKTAVTGAQSVEGMGSAAANALADAALNRALLGRCAEALSLVNETANLLHGQRATLHMGVANALCGEPAPRTAESLRTSASLHSTAIELYLPMLRAADALRERDPLRALGELSALREQRDLPPLALYLRGTAHLGGRQSELASEDFTLVTTHRGRAFLSGLALYGPALASLTRAQLEDGAAAGVARSRLALRTLYAGADRGILSTSATADEGAPRGRRRR